MLEALILFYLLGGWMFYCWTVDNPPPKSWYLIWAIPTWPLSAAILFVLIVHSIVKEAYEKLRNS